MSSVEASPVVKGKRIFIRRRGSKTDKDGLPDESIQSRISDRPKAAPPASGRLPVTPQEEGVPRHRVPESLFPSQDDIARLSTEYFAGRQRRLESLTLEEKLMADRESRVIDRHEAVAREWERFRKRAAEATGRDSGELVITRAEEFRERIELFELLDSVTPLAEKSGEDLWYHTLRDGGVKFIQVGNMFSGLYVPLRLSRMHVISEIIRKPWLKDCCIHREGKSHKTWRDDQYLKDRLIRFRASMREAAAGVLPFDDTLEVRGIKEGPSGEETSGHIEDGSADTRRHGNLDAAENRAPEVLLEVLVSALELGRS
ncbi:hypothetical protein FOZ61_007226 [Perkinsus olseni]|uniref:Uncharacterized protein n=1 Tax=Perkinsus olseni TaxID=32597 RepID=A0A7J6L9Z8_PEROL|nr:hypothetical protein FOZ61_007226 [Perkinsus olseni]